MTSIRSLEASHQYSDQIAAETLGWFKRRLEILQPNIPQHGAGELSLRLTDDQEIQALNSTANTTSPPMF